MGDLRLDIDPASVPVDIYRLDPPQVLFNQSGLLTVIHAAYVEQESGQEIPVGAVKTAPEELTVTDRWGLVEPYTSNVSVVRGVVGDAEIYARASPHAYYDDRKMRIVYYDNEQIASTTRHLQQTAAHQVLAHLGLTVGPQPQEQQSRTRGPFAWLNRLSREN
jgi:hypothetical protein